MSALSAPQIGLLILAAPVLLWAMGVLAASWLEPKEAQ